MSEANVKNDSIALVERIKALMSTMEPGQVTNYLEFDSIEKVIAYRKCIRNSRFGAHGHTSNAGEYGGYDVEKLYREMAAKRDANEAQFPTHMELNGKATAQMVALWNSIHSFIYDSKVYGITCIDGRWTTVPFAYRAELYRVAYEIWGSDTNADTATKENYLALHRRYHEVMKTTLAQIMTKAI